MEKTTEHLKELRALRKRVMKIRREVYSFNEEVALNHVKYALQQAIQVFQNNSNTGDKK